MKNIEGGDTKKRHFFRTFCEHVLEHNSTCFIIYNDYFEFKLITFYILSWKSFWNSLLRKHFLIAHL